MTTLTAENLAPRDGELYLIRAFYRAQQADRLFQQLLAQLDWRQERLFIYGRWIDVPRLMCWYGDPGRHYRYSGVDHEPLPWTDSLLTIKVDVESACGASFNSVLANLYRNGRDSMGCHADDEKELGRNPLIASLSLGERRLLRFRHNQSRQKLDLELRHGDLLLMAGELQHHWKHELPKTRKTKKARINLTFRKIDQLTR
ncbi:alpha-ketoglutarate-dependent dioxygenase AlkB [Methylomarinum sp. Ch1-1]|uniref:Alpha-ketoglutarate-dependent dioxygenase AlkB n=1 Tax=Methylomarinum roseum TaxID=3067653 RepID=A0AAU7NYJ1_9GAMM|nr:alpha-ketoglutarate-dependent dioxygenase AlkB [Methylomarinum sp. Ch1-1]MDP4522277.1 alpha-ketoglutarate-dependent dioxygenase AlkB [Methylomarinum sp. Ch1-1]